MNELIENVSNVAIAKATMLKKSLLRYFILSFMAGMFVGLGILLIMTIGGLLTGSPATKIVMGLSFGIALSLVIMAGSELFTGNNFVMTVGALDKKVSWMDTINIWMVSYIGNLVGSIFTAWLFVSTGLVKGDLAAFILKLTDSKMNGSFAELFFKGILCNILVCLAVLCAIKMKEETAKLIMIFWCLFAFITAGFEHSIANMTLLTIGLLIPHSETITLVGYFNNLLPVTLGNMVGGCLVVGLGYWLVGRK
ncbi:MAG: nitrite transporter NirC [Firmicutes bacterium HGW-Firmicutes-1]|jgi:nitrite transporter NirC|nr:MAG: nitrite transporter NirC [Firmicutes bacterium HGW-Firmicutes-1]